MSVHAYDIRSLQPLVGVVIVVIIRASTAAFCHDNDDDDGRCVQNRLCAFFSAHSVPRSGRARINLNPLLLTRSRIFHRRSYTVGQPRVFVTSVVYVHLKFNSLEYTPQFRQ